ncbi:hypothetical protein DUNSADRAFT_16334 [Dunaliella salina]|uniref:Uncharacterized protein n=1 Tax=Dunaliella salina TaxID=3046 RepID=A0ABQ7H104_DUNSA|nr:hypothetical protein DUNSADRAFT_16334 [Dunaliella salina]|eukprot:KAF5840536.1 hypothetical protein DUNSADRAFT_16334 [Dunaliella salina]
MAVSFFYVVLFVSVGTALPVCFHWQEHGWSWTEASLALFCSINLLVCIWELGLFINRDLILKEYLAFQKTLKKGTLPQPIFMFEHVPLTQAITLKHWSKVWSTYSIMDPSYSDQTSYGFFVDVGNGAVTLVPTIMFSLCMTWDLVPARIMGTIGIIKFYQEMYGTILYYFSYMLNERYKGRPFMHMVLPANFVWIIGPAFGMYACYNMIMSGNYDMFRG